MRMSSLWTVKLVLKVEKGFPREFGAKGCGGEGEDGGAEVEGQEGARRLVRCGLAFQKNLQKEIASMLNVQAQELQGGDGKNQGGEQVLNIPDLHSLHLVVIKAK